MGGYYELVDKFQKTPNPDAWLALLFKEVMGADVIRVNVGTQHVKPDPHFNDVYAFVHCAPDTGKPSRGALLPGSTTVCPNGVGIAAVNLGTTNTTYSVSLSASPTFPGTATPVVMVPRNEFHFAPVEGEPLSTRRVAVNGAELIYKAGAPTVDKPTPNRVTDPSVPLILDPQTIVFVQI
jgi:hypothetical protein